MRCRGVDGVGGVDRSDQADWKGCPCKDACHKCAHLPRRTGYPDIGVASIRSLDRMVAVARTNTSQRRREYGPSG